MTASLDKTIAFFALGETATVLEIPSECGRSVCDASGNLAAVCLNARLCRLAKSVEQLTKEFALQGVRLSTLEGQMTALEDTSERLLCTVRESHHK